MKKQNIKVRIGQIWRKRDTGAISVVKAKGGRDTVKMHTIGSNRVHTTRIQDVQMFWDLLSKQ